MFASILWWGMRIAMVLFLVWAIHAVYKLGREEIQILLGKKKDPETWR